MGNQSSVNSYKIKIKTKKEFVFEWKVCTFKKKSNVNHLKIKEWINYLKKKKKKNGKCLETCWCKLQIEIVLTSILSQATSSSINSPNWKF